MWRNTIRRMYQKVTEGLSWKNVVLILLGTAVCTFGIHNIHQQTGITEGGVIGMMLLLNHWLGAPPSILTQVLDIACYAAAFRFLGWRFIRTSVLSTLSVSLFYQIWDQFPHMLPDLTAHPFLAAVLGGLFVGVGVGIIVRQGGSSGGDDALALTISRVTGWRLSRSYLFTDLTVLALSLSYIPARRIVFSLITVTISSLVIDKIQNLGLAEGGEEGGDFPQKTSPQKRAEDTAGPSS